LENNSASYLKLVISFVDINEYQRKYPRLRDYDPTIVRSAEEATEIADGLKLLQTNGISIATCAENKIGVDLLNYNLP